MKRWLLLGVALTAGLLVFAACPGEEGAPTAQAPEHEEEGEHEGDAVHLILDEWSITGEGGQPIPTLAAGEVTLEVHNEGLAPHYLSIIRTDLPADALPMADGQVDEEAAGDVIGEVDEFPGGQIRVGTFHLEPGRYVFICNIAGHYQQEMFAEVTVR